MHQHRYFPEIGTKEKEMKAQSQLYICGCHNSSNHCYSLVKQCARAYREQTQSSYHATVINMMTIENGQNINKCCISDPICNRRHKLLLIIKSSCFLPSMFPCRHNVSFLPVLNLVFCWQSQSMQMHLAKYMAAMNVFTANSPSRTPLS